MFVKILFISFSLLLSLLVSLPYSFLLQSLPAHTELFLAVKKICKEINL